MHSDDDSTYESAHTEQSGPVYPSWHRGVDALWIPRQPSSEHRNTAFGATSVSSSAALQVSLMENPGFTITAPALQTKHLSSHF